MEAAINRVGAIVQAPDAIYVMEFKYEKSAQKALAQIDERGHLLPCAVDGRTLYKVGVNFSEKAQTIEK